MSKANVKPNLQQSVYNKEIKLYSQTKEKKERKILRKHLETMEFKVEIFFFLNHSFFSFIMIKNGIRVIIFIKNYLDFILAHKKTKGKIRLIKKITKKLKPKQIK
jgi:hypothetical protein